MPYMHRVPNHLETEDKFVLFLSIRQCVILFVTLCMAYMLFNDVFNAIPQTGLALGLGLAAALLVFLAGLALAPIPVHHRGVVKWLFVLFMYAIQPKTYLWRFNTPDDFE